MVTAWGTTVLMIVMFIFIEYFNPHSRVGNDSRRYARSRKSNYFNPRSRVGNDVNQSKLFTFIKFQSTFPRGERHSVTVYTLFVQIFQSTFPRGERLHLLSDYTIPRYFNPRSRVGNDDDPVLRWATNNTFQSTFPRGERRDRYADNNTSDQISIHVPAWGTTE